ncbi:LOB domain-containing protein 21 [Phtheirospermum japonicum]|uniref:LOB domain-containing protein 21 n=1 Tax=Phtheirospermum japonicum TaxID=374723 RepID=A0A830CIA9_9LAMI|nr:LOB domain-containing protein 21 [Phtheirospermum japonicum]
MKSQEPRSTSSCAACKFLKRRCTPNCLFAPYFRGDEPKKFAKVHKVFGASNVSKILNEVAENQREDTVNSLVYEAEVRLQDPVYGCIGAIASLQHKMVELQHDLILARARLASFIDQLPASFLDDPLSMAPFGNIQEPNAGLVDNFGHNSWPLDQFGSLIPLSMIIYIYGTFISVFVWDLKLCNIYLVIKLHFS